jgi:tetratricopeptide (TPR) repeat protein
VLARRDAEARRLATDRLNKEVVAMPNWVSRHIMSEIVKAIEAGDRSTWVFYVTSEGGQGKTILLRQIGMALGSEDGMVPSLRWSGILDLYHSDVNTNSGLEAHLSQALKTEKNEFGSYLEERDVFTARRKAGLYGSELEEERARIAKVFAMCVNAVTEKRRVVIALDTTERVQYEMDEVQRECHLETEATSVRAWLLEQLRLWRNCVVILVGRPEAVPYLSHALEKTLGKDSRVQYVHKTLRGFTEDEARSYFEEKEKEIPGVSQIDLDFRHRLWEMTEGSPIRLDLAVEVIQRGLGFDGFQEKVAQGSPKTVREEMDRLLIQSVMSDPNDELRRVLRYLAVACKGLDDELLHHLAGEWSLDECQMLLKAVAERGFIKRRPNDKRLFLHDEMHQLCDTHLLQAADVQSLSGRIAAWYDKRIKETSDSERRQDLQIDSLLYRLRADPRAGYHWYARQAEFAIRGAQTGFDMQMRNEVLTFLGSKSPIDEKLVCDAQGLREEFNCDGTVRWVKRLMVRGKNELAIEVAEKTSPKFCPDEARFKLARADRAVYHAQAMIYSGNPREAVAMLHGVIGNIEGERKPEELALFQADTYEGWRRNLVLGRAHNNVGYAYRENLGHYNAALKEFLSAVVYFRASDLQEEMANTHDNMGRVYALFRHPTRAAALVDDGLTVRRELGREYRVGLSLNSRAIVYLEFGNPRDALSLSERALGIFEGLETQRGIGLALITLGRAQRQMGGLWKEGVVSRDDCDKHFRRGADVLERAVGIFEGRVSEPIQRIMALNELGCIHRDWAELTQKGASSPLVGTPRAVRAIRYLEQCIELADRLQFPVQYVDACEDLANTYFSRGHYDSARQWLTRAEERVPDEYKFKEGKLLPEIPMEECVEAFWQQMGKVELLRGNLVWDEGTEGGSKPAARDVLRETAEHFLLSSVYFEQYSGLAVGLQSTFSRVYLRFKHSRLDDLRYLYQEALPAIAKKYNVDPTRFISFFGDTLGLTV